MSPSPPVPPAPPVPPPPPPPPPASPNRIGTKEWWLAGDWLRLALQAVGVLFLFTAMAIICVLFWQSFHAGVPVATITSTQGLIAGVLLAAIVTSVIVSVMTVLFSAGAESLKDRTQLVRDILAPLLAIFGTVIGFYFGANTGKDGADPPGKAADKQKAADGKAGDKATDPAPPAKP